LRSAGSLSAAGETERGANLQFIRFHGFNHPKGKEICHFPEQKTVWRLNCQKAFLIRCQENHSHPPVGQRCSGQEEVR